MSDKEYLRCWMEDDELWFPTSEWQLNLFETVTAHIFVPPISEEKAKEMFDEIMRRLYGH